MHPRVFQEFEAVCSERRPQGRVLELGAKPNERALLNMACLSGATEKVGINLDGPYEYRDFRIVKGNANSMTCFGDATFDLVLCNAMLEHDRFFWRTLDEIRRVTRPGGMVMIGAPGFAPLPLRKCIPEGVPDPGFYGDSTITFKVHNSPGDYYRFSIDAFVQVFLEGMRDVEIRAIMAPPRIIGVGVKP